MAISVDAKKAWVVRMDEELVAFQNNMPPGIPAVEAYRLFQFRKFPEALLRRFLVEEVEMKGVSSKDDVYEATRTGFSSLMHGPPELHPFLRIAGANEFVRTDSHYQMRFIN